MIQSKADLRYYMDEDRKAYGKPAPRSLRVRLMAWLFPDNNWEYMRCLRKVEYVLNTGGVGLIW